MSFKTFLEDSNNFEDILQKIEKDCKPFLKHKRALWRGMDVGSEMFGEKKVRKDRKPRGGNERLSAFVNGFLEWKKLPRRDKSIFATTGKDLSGAFGHPCLIFPKREFKFVWFERITDMNNFTNYDLYNLMERLPNDIWKKDYATMYTAVKDGAETPDEQEQVNSLLSSLSYYERGHFPDQGNKNEIIIECDAYYYLMGSPYNQRIDEYPTTHAIKRFDLK